MSQVIKTSITMSSTMEVYNCAVANSKTPLKKSIQAIIIISFVPSADMHQLSPLSTCQSHEKHFVHDRIHVCNNWMNYTKCELSHVEQNLRGHIYILDSFRFDISEFTVTLKICQGKLKCKDKWRLTSWKVSKISLHSFWEQANINFLSWLAASWKHIKYLP